MPYGSTNDGTILQQYSSWNGAPQMFNLIADGSNWHVTMNANNSKCIDLANGGTGNGNQLAVNDCKSGVASQDWTITPDSQTGSFFLKNAASGRCLDEPAFNTGNGVQMDIWDCNSQSNQKFQIQTYFLN